MADIYTFDLQGMKALARDHRRIAGDLENLKRLLQYQRYESAANPVVLVQPSETIGGLSENALGETVVTEGNSNLLSLKDGGALRPAGFNQKVWNLSSIPLTSGSAHIGYREATSGRTVVFTNQVVEIGKADSTIAASSTGGTPGSGTVSIYTFTSTGGTTDTGENVTAFNLSIDSVAAGRWLGLNRHDRTGLWLIIYEDCGTT